MRRSNRLGASIPNLLVGAMLLAGSPSSAFALQEGFHIGISASAEDLDASLSKTVDNTHPMNSTPSSGRTFQVRDSDTKTTSGLGLLAGYSFRLNDRGLYLSAEVDLTYHSGKVRSRLRWIRDSEARERAGRDPDFPLTGESWPDDWTFEKDYSYGLTLRLGGQPDFLASMLGPGSGLYALLGIHRTEAEYVNTYEGCLASAGCPEGREDASYTRGSDRTDLDFTSWSAGIGLHAPVGDRLGIQIEAHYTDYDEEDLLLLDGASEPYVRVPQTLDAEELGLRLRLLRYF